MLSPPVLLLAILFSTLFAGGEPDLNSDAAALLALRIAVGRAALQWNATNSPCVWRGVGCRRNRVVFLRLPAHGLIGDIPTGTLGNLTELRTLSLQLNTLSGRLPQDLNNAAYIRRLYLQNNRFYGKIPPALFSLRMLTHLNLAGNAFTGGISPEFNYLFRLELVCLERNQLSGGIPDLDLPKLVEFNVSFNRLNGSLPSKLWKTPSSSFVGTEVCDGPLVPCSGEMSLAIAPEVAEGEGRSKLSGGAIAGIVVGSMAAVLVVVIVFLFVCKTRVAETPGMVLKKAEFGKKLVFFGSVGEREFDLEDLLRASTVVFEKGKIGTVYKADLEVGRVVAVKRLRDVMLGEEEFREKIEEVGRMRHENIVPLRAYYYSKNEKMLVYDYMPMGSLSALLHGNKTSSRTTLNWETRISIALSAARGIGYIHSRNPAASHGNIKSSNIFLKKALNACVSDNGLVALINPSSSQNLVSAYRAPEVTDFRKVSQKADIYSFGVLLLELLTGMIPKEGVNLPQLVQLVLREEWSTDVLDLELLGQKNVEEMVQLLQIAINCTVHQPDKRPSMHELIAQIEAIAWSSRDTVEVQEQKLQQDEQSGNEAVNDQSIFVKTASPEVC